MNSCTEIKLERNFKRPTISCYTTTVVYRPGCSDDTSVTFDRSMGVECFDGVLVDIFCLLDNSNG